MFLIPASPPKKWGDDWKVKKQNVKIRLKLLKGAGLFPIGKSLFYMTNRERLKTGKAFLGRCLEGYKLKFRTFDGLALNRA